jgi:hypothetical protein
MEIATADGDVIGRCRSRVDGASQGYFIYACNCPAIHNTLNKNNYLSY